MPYYIIRGADKKGAAHVRRENRAAHLAYWQAQGENLAFGGPLLDSEGQMCGSLLALKAASAAEARQKAENDPYNKARLFAELSVNGWNWVANPPQR